jgi:hypothetical protein
MGEDRPRDKREEAARLYRSGMAERKVARRLGLSRARTRELLDDAGVIRRGVGRPAGDREAE